MKFCLSPLTLSGLRVDHEPPKKPRVEDDSGRVEAVLMYRCTECDEVHDHRLDAEDCCPPDDLLLHHEEDSVQCPVCGEEHIDHRYAVDCCLWKDIDAPTRWRIADAVEAGATWHEALGVTRC